MSTPARSSNICLLAAAGARAPGSLSVGLLIMDAHVISIYSHEGNF